MYVPRLYTSVAYGYRGAPHNPFVPLIDVWYLKYVDLQALAQDVTDHKPFIDRLAKVGPNLARLCKTIEGGEVTARLEDVLDRYQSLKSVIKDQSEQLKEKDENAQKVGQFSKCSALHWYSFTLWAENLQWLVRCYRQCLYNHWSDIMGKYLYTDWSNVMGN